MRDYLELNEHENTKCVDIPKAVLEGTFIPLNTLIRKQ